MNSGLDNDVESNVGEDDADLAAHRRRRRNLAIPWGDDAAASGEEEPPPPPVVRRRSSSNGANPQPGAQPDPPEQPDAPAEPAHASNGAAAPPADLGPGQWFVEAPEPLDEFEEPGLGEGGGADWDGHSQPAADGEPGSDDGYVGADDEYLDVEYADDDAVLDEFAVDDYGDDAYVLDESVDDEYAQNEYAQDDYADDDSVDLGTAEPDYEHDGYQPVGHEAGPPEVYDGPPLTPLEERLARRASKLSYRGTRVEAVYDVGGPKVRLGVLWFLLAWTGFALGPLGVGAVFVTAATVAALQVAAHLMIAEDTNSRVTAGVLTAAIGTSAIFDARTVGIVILASVVVAFVVASQTIDREMTVQVAGLTMRAALPLGISMAALLYLHRVDAWVFMILFAVVSIYDAGNFLVGTGSRRVWVGPLAGMIGATTVVFGAAGFEAPPLTETTTWLIGGVTVLVCPLGQIVGSYMLPRPDARAPALRRLDTYLVAAPTMLALFLAIGGNRPLL